MSKRTISGQHNGFDFVEIAGIKWSTCNIGAEKPTDTGLYFQWGDRKGYTADEVGKVKFFNWNDYKHHNGKCITKYNKIDGKRVLDLCDNAAFAYMGQGWRIPTHEDFLCLLDSTTRIWTNNYQGSGIAGMVFRDSTDATKELFFPKSNYCRGKIHELGNCCCYWTSSRPIRNDEAVYLFINNDSFTCLSSISRYFGFAIRGILTI